MAKEYRSALALEQAVKAAARRSGQDVGRAVEGFYAGRLLERVFSEERKPFVLKGGRGILARTLDARYTTDTDFLYRGDDLEEALGELKRLASKDLGDRMEFRFVSADKIAATQEYRDGCRARFEVVLDGTRRKSEIAIDLVADPVELGKADPVTPANRLDVKGLAVFDYLVYPRGEDRGGQGVRHHAVLPRRQGVEPGEGPRRPRAPRDPLRHGGLRPLEGHREGGRGEENRPARRLQGAGILARAPRGGVQEGGCRGEDPRSVARCRGCRKGRQEVRRPSDKAAGRRARMES